MKTFARIVGGHAFDVQAVNDKTDIEDRYPEGQIVTWGGLDSFIEVPSGTVSGAISNGDGTFNNPTPTPRPGATLTKLEFVTLCQTIGGMTDANLVAAKADSNLAALWIKLDMATYVERDNPITGAGLDALAALGYLPNGKASVIAAWPRV